MTSSCGVLAGVADELDDMIQNTADGPRRSSGIPGLSSGGRLEASAFPLRDPPRALVGLPVPKEPEPKEESGPSGAKVS